MMTGKKIPLTGGQPEAANKNIQNDNTRFNTLSETENSIL